MALRYAVDLPDSDRAAWREMISTHKAKRSTLMNAYIVRKADSTCGWTHTAIAGASEGSTKNVEQLKKRFVEAGLAAAWSRQSVTKAHRRKMTGEEEAPLSAWYGRQAPAGQERWPLRMRADTMVEWELIDSISHETIRRTLKKWT